MSVTNTRVLCKNKYISLRIYQISRTSHWHSVLPSGSGVLISIGHLYSKVLTNATIRRRVGSRRSFWKRLLLSIFTPHVDKEFFPIYFFFCLGYRAAYKIRPTKARTNIVTYDWVVITKNEFTRNVK